MKTVRFLAIVPLGLISLMNVGYILPTDPKHNLAVAIAVLALGLAGLGAVYGLARNTTWGVPAALAVAGINVAGAIVALVDDADGAVIGLVVSALALVLAFAASSGARRTSVA
ncbi:hypothetical protein ACVW00_000754 [Marmoricola sp. URHA0025 HA25]